MGAVFGWGVGDDVPVGVGPFIRVFLNVPAVAFQCFFVANDRIEITGLPFEIGASILADAARDGCFVSLNDFRYGSGGQRPWRIPDIDYRCSLKYFVISLIRSPWIQKMKPIRAD